MQTISRKLESGAKTRGTQVGNAAEIDYHWFA